MERSHIALHKWLHGFHLMSSSKKGVSAHQLHRTLAVDLQDRLVHGHRIREAMRDDDPVSGPLGGEGKIVEADETYFGPTEKPRRSAEAQHALHQGRPHWPGEQTRHRCAGRTRWQCPVISCCPCDKDTVGRIVMDNIAKESRLHTDESRLYFGADEQFASHETVKHSARSTFAATFTRTQRKATFSIFKRGMKGIYQHCEEKHLHRYLAEFDFRYNHRVGLGCNDSDRTIAAVKGVAGKRLTYRQPH